jgi:hypothetical protein
VETSSKSCRSSPEMLPSQAVLRCLEVARRMCWESAGLTLGPPCCRAFGFLIWRLHASRLEHEESKATKAELAPQVPRLQQVRPTSSDQYQGAYRVPPEQHHISTGTATGPVLGSGPEMTVEVLQLQQVIPSFSDNRYIPLSRPAATLSPLGGERAGRGVRGN